jgi:DNA anti-recombination protein RmuC
MTQCTVRDDCTDPPVAEYRWPNGQTGLVCARHQMVLRQRAQRVRQHVTITPLSSVAPAPLTVDERTQLHARRLALEAECEQLRARGLELYRDVERLQAALQTAHAQKAALEASLNASTARVGELLEQVGAARQLATEEHAAAEQLRLLVPREEVDLTPSKKLDPPLAE